MRTLAEGVSTGLYLGFEASPIDGRIEATVMIDWMAPNSRTALKVAFDVFGQRAAYEVEDARGVIATVRPDVLVVDANCWGEAAVAYAGFLPWVSFWPLRLSCDRAECRHTGPACARGLDSLAGCEMRRFAHS